MITATPATMIPKHGLATATTVKVAWRYNATFKVTMYRMWDGIYGQMVDVFDDPRIKPDWAGARLWGPKDWQGFKNDRRFQLEDVVVFAVRSQSGRLEWDSDEVIQLIEQGKSLTIRKGARP